MISINKEYIYIYQVFGIWVNTNVHAAKMFHTCENKYIHNIVYLHRSLHIH